jgi:hypothetical protein
LPLQVTDSIEDGTVQSQQFTGNGLSIVLGPLLFLGGVRKRVWFGSMNETAGQRISKNTAGQWMTDDAAVDLSRRGLRKSEHHFPEGAG